MAKGKTSSNNAYKELRSIDTFMDRRSGEDRRTVYSLEYFRDGGLDRRSQSERRDVCERRTDCIRVSKWSSVCPDLKDRELLNGRIIL